MNWDALGAIVTVCVALGGMIMIWHKFSQENAVIRDKVQDNIEKVLSMEYMMNSHYLDTTLHRNTDFEARMDLIAQNIREFVVENKKDHENIIQLIKEKP